MLPSALQFGNVASLSPQTEIDAASLKTLGGMSDSSNVQIREAAENILIAFDGLSAGNLAAGGGIVAVNPGFGITYELNVSVYNAGSEAITIDYILEGVRYHVSWSYEIGDEVGWDDLKGITNIGIKNCFSYSIPPNTLGKFQVWVTMITGSDPTAHHAFIVNASEAQKTQSLMTMENTRDFEENWNNQ